MMRTQRTPAAAAALLFLAASFPRGLPAAEWWNRAWKFRYAVDVTTPGYRCDAATVGLFHGGRAAADGADVRVTDAKGSVVPHIVLQAGPGDFLRLAFRSGGGTGRFYAYLGNRDAAPAGYDWTPQGGLILETRRYNGGSPKSLAAMERIIRKSRPSYGRAFVKHVFHGTNLFGPGERYVSIYEGTLYAPSAGEYVFCTTSDDASFLLVDGRLVVQWPGWHPAAPDTRRRAEVRLEAGRHRFGYLHVNGSGTGITVAAWKPPGGDKIWPIRPQDFGWPGRCRVEGAESPGGPAADFQCEVEDELEYGEGKFAVKVGFRALSGAGPGAVKWEFGDGLEASGERVSHVFLKEGDYEVVMMCGAGEVKNRVRVERRWWKAVEGFGGDREGFERAVERMAPAALDGDLLGALLEFWKGLGREEKALQAAETALDRMEDLSPEALASAALLYTDRIRREDPRKAASLLERAASLLEKSPGPLSKVLLALGDVHFYFLDDPDAALELYDRVVSRFAGTLRDHTVRIAKIRIGDLYRRQGRYRDALQAYREAEKFKLYKWPSDRLAVRKGSLFSQAEQALEKNDLETARETLDTLEWEFPAERLRGEASFLRGRLALKRKNYEEALKQFLDLVNVNPSSPFAADCLLSAALAAEALGEKEKAAALRKRLAEEYPESPAAR